MQDVKYNFEVSNLNLNVKALPPDAKMRFDLGITNQSSLDSIVDKMEVEITIRNEIKTKLNVQNISLRADEKTTFSIEKLLNPVEVVQFFMNPKDEYKVKAKITTGEESHDVEVVSELPSS
jgi:hypothetical protein